MQAPVSHRAYTLQGIHSSGSPDKETSLHYSTLMALRFTNDFIFR